MRPVPHEVLDAFGVVGDSQLLRGGQGTSVAVGGLVLKPGTDAAETAWFAGVCARTSVDGFRLPQPVPAADGRLVVDGWSATPYASGHPVADDDRSSPVWMPVLEAGRAFHRAVQHEPRPSFIDARTHKWAAADREAWAAAPATQGSASARRLIANLSGLIVDEGLPEQLIHGDLSGNVLLDDRLPPAVIDVSPYWRPAAYADAVVVIDALLWWRASRDLLDLTRPIQLPLRSWQSLLARALVFRRLAFDEGSIPPETAARELQRYEEVVELVVG